MREVEYVIVRPFSGRDNFTAKDFAGRSSRRLLRAPQDDVRDDGILRRRSLV
ncbi:MAG: hypothetical protein ACI9CF_000945 [Candidatus Omnitrophota bacterium]|jgi:hypothetical protein